eukprot:scaffold12037_cov159-Ochromonas_danica.AAC.15
MKGKMKEKVVELGTSWHERSIWTFCAAGAWMALYFTVIFRGACILTSLVVARSEISIYMKHAWNLLSSGWSKRQVNEQVRKMAIVQTSDDVDKKTIVELVEEEDSSFKQKASNHNNSDL